MFKKDQGKIGEDAAVAFLKKQGFRIIERNFHIRGGEVDIIATHENTLIFIEVKTRSSSQFGTPLEAITPWKIRSLIKTAEFYKMKHPSLPDAMRIDAVSVMLEKGTISTIELVKDIV